MYIFVSRGLSYLSCIILIIMVEILIFLLGLPKFLIYIFLLALILFLISTSNLFETKYNGNHDFFSISVTN